ncbi:MAG: hypothetical protein ABSG74_13375 [Candidatus Bathyarchaeia archaeon]
MCAHQAWHEDHRDAARQIGDPLRQVLGAFATSDIDRIREALQRTGYPLELEVSAILNKRKYEVWGSQFFERDGKIFEIDMEAIIPIEPLGSMKRWHMNPSVVIECKMSKKYRWVFNKSDTALGHCAISHGLDALALKRKNYVHLCEVLDLHYSNSDVASTFAMVDPEKNSVSTKDEIFDAVSKLREFVNYRNLQLTRFFDSRRRDIIFYFPIIVFDGMLYESDMGSGTLSLTSINSIVLETRTVSCVTGRLEPMYIDVVTKNQFVRHLSVIEGDTRKAAKTLSKRRTQDFLNRELARQSVI